MEIGISYLWNIPVEEQIGYMIKYGVKRTFVGAEYSKLAELMPLLSANGIICDNMHAPYKKINDIWKEGPAGEEMLKSLTDSVDTCKKYDVPILVVHLSSGNPMPEISEVGQKRFADLVQYAKERGVTIAFENQRYLENLKWSLDTFTDSGFCWDCGHESCFTPGMHFMPYFGDRLIALHIHDNSAVYNADNHVLPFDGKMDFAYVAETIADSGYQGTLMLEISKNAKYEDVCVYENLTNEEYYQRAVASACKLRDMIEEYRMK